jgi:hypothetical protein
MPTLNDLETAIDALLDHPLGVGQYHLVRRVEEKAYEAYVFGLCLRAVRELGVTPVLRGITGMPGPFVFRGAPGQIHSTSRNYGYAEFNLNGHNSKSMRESNLGVPGGLPRETFRLSFPHDYQIQAGRWCHASSSQSLAQGCSAESADDV